MTYKKNAEKTKTFLRFVFFFFEEQNPDTNNHSGYLHLKTTKLLWHINMAVCICALVRECYLHKNSDSLIVCGSVL